MDIEFYFDVGSPTAFLAYRRLKQFEERYAATIVLCPMLLGGVFKATGNASPVAIPAKGKYMLEVDLPRFAARYDVPLNFNPYFPINTLTLMRGVFAARALHCEHAYVDAVFDAVWVQQLNMGDPDTLAMALTAASLSTDDILKTAGDPDIKASLISATEAAVARGVFGAPTLFINNEMYFGQDRLDFVEDVLRD